MAKPEPTIPPGPPKPPKKPCPKCGGSGWLMGRGGQYYKCKACNGTGEA